MNINSEAGFPKMTITVTSSSKNALEVESFKLTICMCLSFDVATPLSQILDTDITMMPLSHTVSCVLLAFFNLFTSI